MGLDMYLMKHHYIAAQYDHRKVTGTIDIAIGGQPVKIDFKKIGTITEDVGYWRKANAIHKWFVDNVQDGKDDCEEYDVSYEKLLELKKLCEEILDTKDTSKLEPQSGFFFGSTDVDEWYFKYLKDTVEIISSLDLDGHYRYQSSWLFMSFQSQHELCRSGCGRKVFNRRGICRDCGKQPCPKCGKVFSPQIKHGTLCGPCRKSNHKRTRFEMQSHAEVG